jgi:hypothetical protein
MAAQGVQHMNLHQRLGKAMQKVTYIQKDKKPGMRYSIVSHDVVTAKVRPALLEAGIVYYPTSVQYEQIGNRTQCAMTIRFVNIDEPVDFIDVETFGYGIDDQDKGPGKAMSYAVKYALLKTLGLETGDDPDMDQNVKFDDPNVAALRDFVDQIDLAVTVEGLDNLLGHYRSVIDAVSKVDQAQVNVSRQAFAKKKKELSNAI